MSRVPAILSLMVALFAITLMSGCAKSDASDKAEASRHRSKLLLAEEPTGAKGVIDTRERMPREGEFVIVGKIGGRANPWTEGQASFVLADASIALESDGKHQCDDAGCAFCSKSSKQTEQQLVALVQFNGDDGKVVPIGAQELFEIGASDTVVVRGRAKVSDDGWLIVVADGLYVRK